jgi:hypothetical protein
MREFDEGWSITKHADERRFEMRLSSDDLRGPLFAPVEEYDGGRAHPPGRRVRRGSNGVCLVVEPRGRVILTVLWDGAIGRAADGSPLAATAGTTRIG